MDKKEKASLFQSRLIVIAVVILLFITVLAFFFGENGIFEIIRIQKNIRDLEDHLDELEKEKSRLSAEIKYLKENPQALEKHAREKLWLMKKNEKVVILPAEKEKKSNKKKK